MKLVIFPNFQLKETIHAYAAQPALQNRQQPGPQPRGSGLKPNRHPEGETLPPGRLVNPIDRQERRILVLDLAKSRTDIITNRNEKFC